MLRSSNPLHPISIVCAPAPLHATAPPVTHFTILHSSRQQILLQHLSRLSNPTVQHFLHRRYQWHSPIIWYCTPATAHIYPRTPHHVSFHSISSIVVLHNLPDDIILYTHAAASTLSISSTTNSSDICTTQHYLTYSNHCSPVIITVPVKSCIPFTTTLYRYTYKPYITPSIE